jgi:hypothetical protein
MHNIMWGNLACYNLDVDGEMRAMGCKARIWEGNEIVLKPD